MSSCSRSVTNGVLSRNLIPLAGLTCAYSPDSRPLNAREPERPIGDLSSTAEDLGRALGGLIFAQETSGRYGELPAFVAESDGLRYALLGVPSPEDDVRDVRTQDFELMAEPVLPQGDGPMIDVSENVIARISGDGRVRCWSLK